MKLCIHKMGIAVLSILCICVEIMCLRRSEQFLAHSKYLILIIANKINNDM